MIHAPKSDEQKRALEQFLAKPPRLRRKQQQDVATTILTPTSQVCDATPIVTPAEQQPVTSIQNQDVNKNKELRKRKRTTPSTSKPNKRQKTNNKHKNENTESLPEQQSLQHESVFALLQSVESKTTTAAPTNKPAVTPAPRISKRKAANVNKSHYESNMPICTFYLQGKCTKGTACIFKHEGEMISHKHEICKFFLANACAKGDECPFSHDSSTFPCKFFYILGNCSKGAECKFSHQEPTAEQMDVLIKLDKQHREQKEAAKTEDVTVVAIAVEDVQKEDVLFDPFAAVQVPATYMPQSPPATSDAAVTLPISAPEPSFSFGNVFAK